MKKILIVEDDQIVANIYRNKLSVEGFKVEVANTGEAGFEQVISFRPDAVILDLILPKISGVELMKKVRAEEDFKTLPLIVFSNTYLTNMVQDAWKAGATKCLSKANCSPKQVVDALRSTLGLMTAEPTKAAASAPRARLGTPESPTSIANSNSKSERADQEFQSELRITFVKTLRDTLTALRTSLQALAKADNDLNRAAHARDMYHRVRTLTGNAGLAGLHIIAQLGEPLEAFLKELHEKPAALNPSSLRTVASAVDFLGFLFERVAGAEKLPPTNPNILVVDDEAISRRAVTHALEKAKLKATGVEDPTIALKLLNEGYYDLVFLDVDMPGMNGFELCTKIRSLERYKTTPIVFVTSLNGFESRANSMMSGGNDLIGKPFHFLELAVKALVFVLRAKYPAKAKA